MAKTGTKLLSTGIVLIFIAFGLFGCTSGNIQGDQTTEAAQNKDGEKGHLENVEIAVSNQGSLETQVLCVSMKFNKDVIGIKVNDFQVILNEKKMEEDAVRLETDGSEVRLVLSIALLKDGRLELSCCSSEINSFRVQAVVSPGLELVVVEQDPEKARTVMQVSHLFDVRGIAQIALLENGEMVPTQDTGDMISYVHGHDFLKIDACMAAQSVAEILSERYPEGYLFTAQNDQITVDKTNAEEPVELELTVIKSVSFHEE